MFQASGFEFYFDLKLVNTPHNLTSQVPSHTYKTLLQKRNSLALAPQQRESGHNDQVQ